MGDSERFVAYIRLSARYDQLDAVLNRAAVAVADFDWWLFWYRDPASAWWESL